MKDDSTNEKLLYIAVERQDIRTSRTFTKNAKHGMRVSRSVTINFDAPTIVEHIEMACPNYELTPDGPVYTRKKKDTNEK